jgi:hypothetical protein
MRSSSFAEVMMKGGGGSFQIVQSFMEWDVLGGLINVMLLVGYRTRCSRIAATAALLIMVEIGWQFVQNCVCTGLRTDWDFNC